MPPIVIGAAIAGTAVVASTVIASNAQKKAQEEAQNFANQQAEESRQEQTRLEEKYGLTPGELERQDRTFALEKERETELSRRSGLSGEELLREEGGTTTSNLLNRVDERLGKSGKDLFLEEGGVPAQQYYDRVTSPTDQGILANELELVRQMVNAEANRRGVFGGLPEGGIRFEQLGRSGVELAIKSAREKMAQQAQLSNAFINMAQNARAEAGNVGESALTASRGARSELDTFLATQQQLDAQSKGRAANVALKAANLTDSANERQFGVVQDIYGQQAGEAGAIKQAGIGAISDVAGQVIGNVIYPQTKTTTVPSVESPALLAGGSTSLRTKGYVDEELLADEYYNSRKRRY